MYTRGQKKPKKQSDQIIEPWTWLVSWLQVHLSPSILWYLGTLEGLDTSSRHTGPPLPASTENRSLILPPAKAPSAPAAQHNDKNLHQPTHSHANLDSNTLWQFVFDTAYPLDALQLLSATTIVSRINAFDVAQRYFSVFANDILPVFCIVSQLFKLVVCSASVRDGAAHRDLESREGECRFWYGISYLCVCRPNGQENFPTIPQKSKCVVKSNVDPNNLYGGDLWDLHEVNLPEVMEEWGHFKSHYYVIKSRFSL